MKFKLLILSALCLFSIDAQASVYQHIGNHLSQQITDHPIKTMVYGIGMALCIAHQFDPFCQTLEIENTELSDVSSLNDTVLMTTFDWSKFPKKFTVKIPEDFDLEEIQSDLGGGKKTTLIKNLKSTQNVYNIDKMMRPAMYGATFSAALLFGAYIAQLNK